MQILRFMDVANIFLRIGIGTFKSSFLTTRMYGTKCLDIFLHKD